MPATPSPTNPWSIANIGDNWTSGAAASSSFIRRASATNARPSFGSGAKGFSTTTCLPASSARRASGAWVSGAVVIRIRSTSLDRTASSVATTSVPGRRAASSRRAFGRRSQTGPASAVPAAISGSRVRRYALDALPAPITPTRTGPCRTRRAGTTRSRSGASCSCSAERRSSWAPRRGPSRRRRRSPAGTPG